MSLRKMLFGEEPIGPQVGGSLIAIAIAIAAAIAIDWLMTVELGVGWTLLLLLFIATTGVLRLALGLLAAIVSIFRPE